jgi:hypothetical protein
MFPSLHSPEPRYGVRPYYTIHLIALLNRIRVLVADTIVSATRDTRYSSFIYCLRRLYPFLSPFPETARIPRLNLTEESMRSSGLNTNPWAMISVFLWAASKLGVHFSIHSLLFASFISISELTNLLSVSAPRPQRSLDPVA